MSNLRVAFWTGFRQGLTWPLAFPMMWMLYGIGMIGYVVIEKLAKDEGPDRWWHHAAFRVYQFGTIKSVYWNDMGGFSLWRKP